MSRCAAVEGAMSASSAMARLLLLCAASGLLLAALAAIPPPEEAARMARYVLHSCDWGALATLSAQEGLRGRPFANIFSLSDGPPGPCGGSGVPYLYLTDMEISVQDLEQVVIARQCDSVGSRSHGIAGAGRDLWRSFSPTPATAGSPRAGDTGTCPGMSPRLSALGTIISP